jgi:hypothetical protein
MRRLYFITILIVAATICGCNKSGVEVGKSDEMTFSAVYPGSSKATDAGFESGDKMGLYVTHYETTARPCPGNCGGLCLQHRLDIRWDLMDL